MTQMDVFVIDGGIGKNTTERLQVNTLYYLNNVLQNGRNVRFIVNSYSL